MGQMAEMQRMQVDWTAFEDVADSRKRSNGAYMSLDEGRAGNARNWQGKTTEYGRHGGAREWKLELGLYPMDPAACLNCGLPKCAYEGRRACPYVKAIQNEQAARQRERMRTRYQTDLEYRARAIEYGKHYRSVNRRPAKESEEREPSPTTVFADLRHQVFASKREKLAAEQAAMRELFLSRKHSHRAARA